MAAPLIVRLVMDAAGYLKTVDTAVASNTKLEQSSLAVGEAVGVSAKEQVAASLRATKALEAQIAGQRQLAASATESAEVRERANLLADRAQGRRNSSLGLTAAATRGAGTGAKTAERDFGKFTRGALAGSGAASSLGRSLAFASTGFIAIAGTSTIIAGSIKAALDLAKTQRQVEQQLKTTGKSWDQYGQQIDQADLKLSHVSGFTNQELLQSFTTLFRVTGNVSKSLTLNALAADVARGRNISLTAASNALAKAEAGSFSALRRLNIVVPQGSTKLQALAFVQEKYAGQAAAGATVTDKFHAALVNTQEIIGTALLPTFTRLTNEASDWLAKMSETGRLQHDVNELISIGGFAFHLLGDIIKGVDFVTRSFQNTLEILLFSFSVKKIITFSNALLGLAAKWGIVGAAATDAAAAEAAAGGAGAAAGAAGVAEGAAGVALTVSAPLVAGAAALGVVTFAGLTSGTGKSKVTTGTSGSQQRVIVEGVGPMLKQGGQWYRVGRGVLALASPEQASLAESVLHPAGAPNVPSFTQGIHGRGFQQQSLAANVTSARSPTVFKSFTDSISNQLAQARAALTKSTADDVAAAKAEIALIKREIDRGRFTGAGLIQALQAEASAQGILDSARQAAAAQAAKIAAAKKAAASSYTTPIDLQLAEARAALTATSADDISAARRILAAAKAALASGRKNKQGQLAALQAELQAQQALDALRNQSTTSFTQSPKLQLALARAQALGLNQTGILLKMKAALERALKAAKGNIQKQIDIYNQITAINQQLGSSVTAALGGFRQASTRALTAGLGLTAAQREALRPRLSQRGPGGTVPGSGTGAGGFIIGKHGRPTGSRPARRPPPPRGRPTRPPREPAYNSQANFNRVLAKLEKVAERPIRVIVDLDGKVISDNTTRHQQRARRRNPSQRRGPHAGYAGA